MGKIEWPSEEEKWRSIGFLAIHGVINSIEATVPKGKTREFQLKFIGKYDSNFPYEADKFGRQFRIYLNEAALEDCPTFLYNQLDTQYKNRINDTEFIEDLVLNWGFRFSNNYIVDHNIDHIVKEKGEHVYECFRRGNKPEYNFIASFQEKFRDNAGLCDPTIKDLSDRKPHTKKGKKNSQPLSDAKHYSSHFLTRLGWYGEAYIYELLMRRNEAFYEQMNLDSSEILDIVWHNQGYLTAEMPGRWVDQSVGHGYDLLVNTDQGPFYVEVKASKRKYPVFTMTATEIQKMAKTRERYFLVKINYLERILLDRSPEISVYTNPYEYFFNVDQIKEATFYLE